MSNDTMDKVRDLADTIIKTAEKFGYSAPELLRSEIGAEYLYRIELCLSSMRETLGHSSKVERMNGRILEIGDLEEGRGAVIELSKEDTLALARGSYLYEAAEIVVRSKRPGIHPPEGE